MKLNLCQSCHHHILSETPCPRCHKSSNPTKLTLPIALILGIGCAKKDSAPTPEVMALYGGPPVEMQEVELQTEDTGTTESSDKSPIENTQQSEDITNTDESNSTENKPETQPE